MPRVMQFMAALIIHRKLKAAGVLALACAGFLISGTNSAGQQTPNRSTSAQTVTVIACPVHGVEAGCMVITGKDGKTWEIGSAKPRPRVGYRAISLTGQISKKASICMQGTVLENIQWTYTDEQCPEPKQQ